jgi:ABC-type transport system substrate-binding protein
VTLSPQERSQQAQAWSSGQYDLYMNYYPGAADLSLAYASLFGEGSVLNPAGPPPAEVTTLMNQARNEVNVDKRVPAFQALAKSVDDQALAVFIVHPAIPLVSAANIQGMQGYLGGIPELRGVSKKTS